MRRFAKIALNTVVICAQRQGVVPGTPNFLVDSREFPCHPCSTDEDGTQDRAKRPKRRKSGFIQAPAFIEPKRSDARASRHPPRWHAQLDTPSDGTRAADWAVAAAQSAVVLSRARDLAVKRFGGRGQVRSAGPWHAGSEDRRRSRWTRKVACPFLPRFAG